MSDLNETSEIREDTGGTDEVLHSKANMASYGFGKFLIEFIDMAFGAYAFFFYETEIGLDVWLSAFGFTIYAIWNAVNDPIVGYITDRQFKFTKKWGRRYPFILMGGIPYILSYILIFTPPAVDATSGAWVLLAWLVFTTCLFDTFASIMGVNYYALFPDKFRSDRERRMATGVSTPVGVLGIAAGALVPPLLVTYGVRESYIIQAGGVVFVAIIAAFLMIPGVKEDRATIDRYLAKKDEQMEKRESFFKTLRGALSQRNFLVFLVVYFLYRTLVISMTASINYVVRYILGKEAGTVTLLMAGFLVGALVSVPLWTKLAHKTNNNKKVILIGAAVLTAGTIPLIFLEDEIGILLSMALWGVGLGGFWTMLAPVLADVIDETVVNTGKREEGMYTGFRAFFGRLGLVSQALIFAIAHKATGFVEGSETQTPLAIWGIHVHLALVPAILMFLATLILWKFYDLTPEKVAKIKEELEELEL
ncbi:MAG: MFS transporter [Promethearchaeota archaeon]